MAVKHIDYYEVLEVPRNASEADIKSAYRRLARTHHPDLNPGNRQAEERFKRINEAYEVLGNPTNRRKYDLLGEHWNGYRPGNGGGASTGAPDLSDLMDNLGSVSDFLKNMFGGNGGRTTGSGPRTEPPPAQPRGADLQAPVTLTLEEVMAGGTKVLTLRGQRIQVKLRPGLKEGQRLRVRGRGTPGEPGMPPGDLYLIVKLAPHPIYTREGDDLLADLPMDLYTAVLGGTVDFLSLDGPLRVPIPAGTQQGAVLRLKGKGLPNAAGTRGNLRLRARISLPQHLTAEEKSLFERLASLRA